MPNIIMADAKDGGILYEPKSGCFYKKHLDITLENVPSNVDAVTRRYHSCSDLKTAIVRDPTGRIGNNGYGNSMFRSCPELEEVSVPECQSTNTYLVYGCPKLKRVTLGSIGHPVSTISGNTFPGCGGSASNKTITVYVADSTTIPLANAPWGLTDATVIYRSSTTGEVRTE